MLDATAPLNGAAKGGGILGEFALCLKLKVAQMG